MTRKISFLLPALCLMFTFTACAPAHLHTNDQYPPPLTRDGTPAKDPDRNTHNNNVPIEALVEHILTKTEATPLCDMEPGPVHAERGFSVMLAGRQVAFYKYNVRRKKMRAKLDYIIKHKCVFILGHKYPAAVNGSFVMIDHELNPQRDLLLKVFEEF